MRGSFLRQVDNFGDAFRRNRSLAGRAGFVAQKTIDAFVHEALLPAPDAGLRLACRFHNRRGAKALVAQQYDTRTPDMLLQAARRRSNVTQALTVRC
jgi:hypothetical protein